MKYFDDLEDLRIKGRQILPTGEVSRFEPREGQERVVLSTDDYLCRHNGGILVADCGTGKTYMGAELAFLFGVSTCVLVHAEFLAEQWEEAFAAIAPQLSMGRTQRDRCDTGFTHDIVVAVTQSIVNSKREYPEEFYNSFGFLIGDEMHRYGAETWQKAITKFSAKYRLGLTATPDRADGCWPILEHHVGGIAAELHKEVPVEIHIRKTYITVPKESYAPAWLTEATHQRAKLLSILAEHEPRNEYIAKDILPAIKANRRIFIVSERLVQLEWMFKRFKAYGISEEDMGFYIGGKKLEQLERASKRQIILATYNMASEGLNIPELDCCFLITPRVKIQQIIGRIIRDLAGKKTPKVVDYADINIPLLKGYMFGRINQYKKLGYEVMD
jgi:superfamily II DNA or RNA helicase